MSNCVEILSRYAPPIRVVRGDCGRKQNKLLLKAPCLAPVSRHVFQPKLLAHPEIIGGLGRFGEVDLKWKPFRKRGGFAFRNRA